VSSIDLVVRSVCEVTLQGMVPREEVVVMHMTGSRIVESLELDSLRKLAGLVVQIEECVPAGGVKESVLCEG
jgi:hypothetical protein